MSFPGGKAEFICSCHNSVKWYFEQDSNTSPGALQYLKKVKEKAIQINHVDWSNIGNYHCLCQQRMSISTNKKYVVATASLTADSKSEPH